MSFYEEYEDEEIYSDYIPKEINCGTSYGGYNQKEIDIANNFVASEWETDVKSELQKFGIDVKSELQKFSIPSERKDGNLEEDGAYDVILDFVANHWDEPESEESYVYDYDNYDPEFREKVFRNRALKGEPVQTIIEDRDIVLLAKQLILETFVNGGGNVFEMTKNSSGRQALRALNETCFDAPHAILNLKPT